VSFARNLKIVHVLNRTTKPINATWDGYPYVIPPGFKYIEVETLQPRLDAKGKPVLDAESKEPMIDTVREKRLVGNGSHGDPYLFPMPYFAAEAAMRQNPKMGTLNPLNPNDFEPLVCVPEWGHPLEHTEQDDDAIELIDRSFLPHERQNVKHEHVPGTRRAPKGGNRYAMYGGRQSLAHNNPFGMQGDDMGGSATYGL
jgi:hypothetical protein